MHRCAASGDVRLTGLFERVRKRPHAVRRYYTCELFVERDLAFEDGHATSLSCKRYRCRGACTATQLEEEEVNARTEDDGEAAFASSLLSDIIYEVVGVPVIIIVVFEQSSTAVARISLMRNPWAMLQRSSVQGLRRN